MPFGATLKFSSRLMAVPWNLTIYRHHRQSTTQNHSRVVLNDSVPQEYQEATNFDTTSEKAIFDEYYSLSNSEQRPIIDPFTMVLKASLFQTRDGSLVRHLAI